MVREWDPRTAPSEEIENMVASLNAMLAVDLPDDPPWRSDAFREYMSVTMPGERRVIWVATGADDKILGQSNVLLFGEMAVLEVHVLPEARRHGVGAKLLAEAVRRAHQEGFQSLGVEVIGGTPAVQFYENAGFECAYSETRSVLDMRDVDWLRLGEMAAGIGAGYRVEYHPGGPPEDLYESYASAKYVTRGIEEPPDLELRPSSFDAERLRASLKTLHMRGMKPYVVIAVHESTGDVVGLTEVVVAAQHPERADQYDTIVVPEHRGYGLQRALKARMLFELRSAEPALRSVQTWNSDDAEEMRKINAELGFKADREWREYEADVPSMARHLGVA
jgi:GNAT superfamily N-acetyltransferase